MVDFRVGSRKGAKDLPIKAKRSSNSYILPNLVRKTASPLTLVKEAVKVGSDTKTDDKQSQEQDLPYVFTPNKMPKQKQLFYQVCDLHDPEIQRLVSKNDEQVCSYYGLIRRECYTVEAPVSRHPREAEKVSATGAGRLQE